MEKGVLGYVASARQEMAGQDFQNQVPWDMMSMNDNVNNIASLMCSEIRCYKCLCVDSLAPMCNCSEPDGRTIGLLI